MTDMDDDKAYKFQTDRENKVNKLNKRGHLT